MASSGAGPSLGGEYDVFLSFRGSDSRGAFPDYLYQSLVDAGIRVFRDDNVLPAGERIDGSLLRGINNSRIYIPIFSPNYASSQRCLHLLAHIVESTSRSGGDKEILPVFFDVNPDEVKLKTPLYRDAIFKLELMKGLSSELVETWREALMKVDETKGWEVKKYKGILGNNTFWMHNLFRDLGRAIIRRENLSNPEKRSRIWIHEEALYAMGTAEMKRKVQALSLDSYAKKSFTDDVVLSGEIGRFENLRFLKLLGGTFAGDLANCFPNLRWISWHFPPRKYEWKNMHLDNVVVVEFTGIDLLDDSRLRDLIKRARRLKNLYLKSCHKIMTTPDFSGCPTLERLTFEDCSILSRIDSSIGKLKYLIDLKIDRCFSLKDLPEEIGDLVNLKHFSVQRCKAKKLPDSIWKLISLRELHFSSSFSALASADLWELPSAIGRLHNLEVLVVNSHNLKGQLPSGIEILPSLRILDLSHTQVSELPKNISMLPRLQVLELIACHKIQELPALPTSLIHLRVSSASLRAIPNLSNLTNLVRFDVMKVDDVD